MSVGRNRLKKERKKARSPEHKRIARQVKQGVLPKYMFAKHTLEDGRTEILEPRKLQYKARQLPDGTTEKAYKANGLTLRLVDVIKYLMGGTS